MWEFTSKSTQTWSLQPLFCQLHLQFSTVFEGEFEIFFRVLQIISAFFLIEWSFFEKKPSFPPWRMGEKRKLAKDILQLLLLLGKRKGKRETICSTIKKNCSGSNDQLGLNALQRVSFKVISQNKFSYFTYIFSTKTPITISKSKNKIAISQHKYWQTSQ